MNGRKREIPKAIKGAGVTLALVLAPVALAAQSCAMCYQSAAASGPRTIHALNSGILILMFPPALITLGIFYLGYKKRNTFNEGA
jgi:ABC-type arginine/histidine transport system permease subunit